MQLQDLLEQVRQRRETDRLEKERIAQEQRAIETEKEQNLLREFAGAVQEYFGDLLDALNADTSSQYLDRDLKCSFAIKHAIVSISMLDRDVQNENIQTVGISARAAEGYFSRLPILQPCIGYTAWFDPQKSLNHLQELIFDICEEYDHLLPEFETVRKLAEYRRAIEEAVEKSDREIAVLNTVLKAWQWPEEGRRQLKLYKITWQKHGFLDAQGEAHFDYESGWSLSDLPRSFEGYFTLLPERGKPAREVKPGYPVTVARYYFTKDDLPEELLERPTQQLEVAKVHDCIREDWDRLLPQFVPALPPEIADNFAIEPAIATFDLDVPMRPGLEIRQALSLDIPGTDVNTHPF